MKLRVHFNSSGKEIPAVIEQISPLSALELLHGEYRHDPQSPHVPFIVTMGPPNGKIFAASINHLVREGQRTVMECDRTIKWQSEMETKIEGVGLCFLIALLLYMKTNGFWYEQGELLYNLIPEVLNSYRRKLGIAEMTPQLNLTGLALDGVTAREAEKFLKASPFNFENPSLNF